MFTGDVVLNNLYVKENLLVRQFYVIFCSWLFYGPRHFIVAELSSCCANVHIICHLCLLLVVSVQ